MADQPDLRWQRQTTGCTRRQGDGAAAWESGPRWVADLGDAADLQWPIPKTPSVILIPSGGSLLTWLPVSDASILLRDIAGDAAQSAATRVNPSQDQLSQIDQAADDNTWHEVPDLSRDNLKNQAKNQYSKQKPFSRGDVKNAAGDATQAAHPSGSRDPADAADLAARDQQYGTDSGVDAQSGAMAGAQNLRNQAAQNIPQETQDKAKNVGNRSKEYIKGKLPQERRDQTIYRLKKMIVEIQGHQDCKSSCRPIPVIRLTSPGHRSASGGDSAQFGRTVRWTRKKLESARCWHCERCSQRFGLVFG